LSWYIAASILLEILEDIGQKAGIDYMEDRIKRNLVVNRKQEK